MKLSSLLIDTTLTFLKEASLGKNFNWVDGKFEPSAGGGDVTKAYVDASINTLKSKDASLDASINAIWTNAVDISTILTTILTPTIDTSTAIKFDIVPGYIYGTTTSPITGNITLNSIGAITGVTDLIIHQTTSSPSFTSTFKKINGNYDTCTNTINFIYVQYVDASNQLYTINQIQ
jgi:hypothetical protein